MRLSAVLRDLPIINNSAAGVLLRRQENVQIPEENVDVEGGLNTEYIKTARGVLTALQIVFNVAIVIVLAYECRPLFIDVPFIIGACGFFQSLVLGICSLLSRQTDEMLKASNLEVVHNILFSVMYLFTIIVLASNFTLQDKGYERKLAGLIFSFCCLLLYIVNAAWKVGTRAN